MLLDPPILEKPTPPNQSDSSSSAFTFHIPPTPVADHAIDSIRPPHTIELLKPIEPAKPLSSKPDSSASEEENEAPVLDGTSKFKCSRAGRFAHPNSCEKYYFCWDAIHDHAVFTCPYNKAFNPKTQHCEYDFSVCNTAPKCQADGEFLPNQEDKSTYFECRFMKPFSDEDESDNQYRLYKENCDNGGEFDADLGYCKLTEEDEDDSSESEESANKVECNEPGVFIDHSDDSRYYECIAKNVTYAKIHQTCPNNYVFSMADKRCIKLDTDKK